MLDGLRILISVVNQSVESLQSTNPGDLIVMVVFMTEMAKMCGDGDWTWSGIGCLISGVAIPRTRRQLVTWLVDVVSGVVSDVVSNHVTNHTTNHVH